ncbi:hypothetical protein ACHAWF_002491 [Thalassiosira exigua]
MIMITIPSPAHFVSLLLPYLPSLTAPPPRHAAGHYLRPPAPFVAIFAAADAIGPSPQRVRWLRSTADVGPENDRQSALLYSRSALPACCTLPVDSSAQTCRVLRQDGVDPSGLRPSSLAARRPPRLCFSNGLKHIEGAKAVAAEPRTIRPPPHPPTRLSSPPTANPRWEYLFAGAAQAGTGPYDVVSQWRKFALTECDGITYQNKYLHIDYDSVSGRHVGGVSASDFVIRIVSSPILYHVAIVLLLPVNDAVQGQGENIRLSSFMGAIAITDLMKPPSAPRRWTRPPSTSPSTTRAGVEDLPGLDYGGWPTPESGELPVALPDLPTVAPAPTAPSLLATAWKEKDGDRRSAITPPSGHDRAVADGQAEVVVDAARSKGGKRKGGVTPSPMPPKVEASKAVAKPAPPAKKPVLSGKALESHRKWQAEAERMGGPAA